MQKNNLKLMSADLQKEFSDMKGFSKESLKRIHYWYLFYLESLMGLQPVTSLENAERKIKSKSVPQRHNGRDFSADWNQKI